MGLSGIPVNSTPEELEIYKNQAQEKIYEIVMHLGEQLGKRILDIKDSHGDN